MPKAKGVPLQATITFTYLANPAHYPEHTPERMAALDKLGFTGDTERLLEMLCGVAYQIEVVPKG